MSAMRRPLFALLAVGTAVALAAACDSERATSADPTGDNAYGVSLALSGTLPRGTARFIYHPKGDTAGAIVPDTTAPVPPSRFAVSDTLHLDFTGLDTLSNGFYVLWIGDDSGSFKQVTYPLVVIHTDTVLNSFGEPAPAVTVDTIPNVSAFQNGGPRNEFNVTIDHATTGLAPSDSIESVLFTVEDTPNPTAPNFRRAFLWARVGSKPARGSKQFGILSVTRALSFGTFGTSFAEAQRFIPNGRGRLEIRGSELKVNDSSLTRPPLGYYYAAFAVLLDSVTNDPIDTVYLGELTTPIPGTVSLRDADSIVVDPGVQIMEPPSILAANAKIDADTIPLLQGLENPFKGFGNVFVTLQPKFFPTGVMGTDIILRTFVPDFIRRGK